MKVRVSIKGILEYVSIFTLLLECSSIYFNMVGGMPITSNWLLIIGFFPLTISVILKRLKSKKTRVISTLLLYFLYTAVYAITLGKQEIINFAMKFWMIFPCILIYIVSISEDGTIIRYLNKYINVVCIIASSSLLFWLFGSLLKIIPATGTVQYVWGSMNQTARSYFNIHFETQIEKTFIGITRNTAFFTEAPKFSLILLFAYLFNELFRHSKRIRILLGITIVSTLAYSGVIGILLIHFCRYTINVIRDIASRKSKVRTIVWPILMLSGVIIFWYLMDTKLSTSSGVGRLGDFIVCISTGLQHPFFGFGFMDNEYLNTVLHAYRLSTGVGNTMGLSNSICQIFIDGGLYLLILYIVPACNVLMKGIKSRKYILVIFSIFYMYMFTTTYFAYTGMIFFLISIFIGITSTKKWNIVTLN